MTDKDEVARLRTWLEQIGRQKWGGALARKALAGEVYVPLPPPPEMVCSKCGISDSEAMYLTPFRVITCQGEEGYSDVTMMLCEADDGEIKEALYNLGFRDHAHGGTALLQDDDCPGGQYNEEHRLNPCPTPTDPYTGTYIVGNYELSPGRELKDDEY